MKTSLYLLLGAGLLGGACQRTTETEVPTATAPVEAATNTTTVAVDAKPAESAANSEVVVPASSLSAEHLAVLRRTDLAPLLLPASYEDEEGMRSSGQTMNGFFGPEHRRIEFVFTRVERDAQNPALYHVSGKDRYKKRITPLEGTIELTSLAPLRTDKSSPDDMAAGYAAAGTFELREIGSQSGTGTFRGRAAIDFNYDEHRKPALAMWGYAEPSMAAKGAGSRFEGQWTSNQTRQQKAVLWADGNGLFTIAQDIFADFNVGERGPEINEKYAKLGWDSYWENEEWWAETPKTATVSL